MEMLSEAMRLKHSSVKYDSLRNMLIVNEGERHVNELTSFHFLSFARK